MTKTMEENLELLGQLLIERLRSVEQPITFPFSLSTPIFPKETSPSPFVSISHSSPVNNSTIQPEEVANILIMSAKKEKENSRLFPVSVFAQVPPEFSRPRYALVEAEDMASDVIQVGAAGELVLYVGEQTSDNIIAGSGRFVHAEKYRVHLRQHPRVLVGFPTDHHAVHVLQVLLALLQVLHAAVEHNLQFREILL